MIDKIIELYDKGYCNECNELNCLGGEPSSKTVANAIRELQQENCQLKDQFKQRDEVIDEADSLITDYLCSEEYCSLDVPLVANLFMKLKQTLQRYRGDNK